jgi:hypothetical protein
MRHLSPSLTSGRTLWAITMHWCLWMTPVLCLLNACSTPSVSVQADRKILAERYFRGVYGCNPSIIDELAATNIVVSYPIFEQILQTPAIRGRDAVKGFANRFCSRWSDAQISIDKAIAERDQVVLVWSFRARNIAPLQPGQTPSGAEQSWGGITLFRFGPDNKVVAELGEESAPGPFGRLASEPAVK